MSGPVRAGELSYQVGREDPQLVGRVSSTDRPAVTSKIDDVRPNCALGYAIVLPGRKWAFRAGFWPDCYQEGTNIGGPISVLSR